MTYEIGLNRNTPEMSFCVSHVHFAAPYNVCNGFLMMLITAKHYVSKVTSFEQRVFLL